MKRALLLVSHGCGDVLMATPALRALYDKGYEIDIMLRESVVKSGLLNDCPWIRFEHGIC